MGEGGGKKKYRLSYILFKISVSIVLLYIGAAARTILAFKYSFIQGSGF
jgi:hypothetical protein